MEGADTPSLDALCQNSETGLMTAKNGQEFNRREKLYDLTCLRSLAITNGTTQRVLEQCFEFDHLKAVGSLVDFEDTLEEEWNSFDFFYIHLDGECELLRKLCDPARGEWVEMVDAWLPGLLGRFRPEVFALSGDLDAVVSRGASILSMIHSPLSHPQSNGGLSRRTCRDGRLGEQVDLREWLLLLMAHSSRRESYRAALELYSR